MSTRMTKSTLTALERTDFVIASIRTQKTTVTAALTEALATSLPDGATMPDWDTLQEIHASQLELSRREVRLTERDYRQRLDQMRSYRRQRQSTVDRLVAGYRRLRRSVTGNYPEDALTVLGVVEQPIRRFAAVREQMPELLARLRNPEVLETLPDPLLGHQPLDFESFAVPLETDIQALAESMESVREMRKVLDEAVVAKYDALEKNRRIYVQAARIQEGYYRLAGLDDLADRIRTEVFLISPRRKDQEASPDDTSSETSPDPSSENRPNQNGDAPETEPATAAEPQTASGSA